MPRRFVLSSLVLSMFVSLLAASEVNVVSSRNTVGPPIVFTPPPMRQPPDRKGRLIVVNWNVHVGHGDIKALLKTISDAENAKGLGKPEFVLLLEESFRQGAEIPASTGVKAPRRIAPPDSAMDIEDLARSFGWWLYYAPSMRNGDLVGADAEDRGNAILSSLPLRDVKAFELPFGVQRRVALTAAITDVQGQPRLRVAVTHFDTRAPLMKGWIFGGPATRNDQAKGFVSALKEVGIDNLPLVIGGDLNTYMGSQALETVSEIAPHANCGSVATHILGMKLDHLFARIPGSWASECVRGQSTHGSDHYPLMLHMNVSW